MRRQGVELMLLGATLVVMGIVAVLQLAQVLMGVIDVFACVMLALFAVTVVVGGVLYVSAGVLMGGNERAGRHLVLWSEVLAWGSIFPLMAAAITVSVEMGYWFMVPAYIVAAVFAAFKVFSAVRWARYG